MALEKFIGPQKAYLKSSEIAKIFNVDHSTVFLWVKKRKLHPIRTPGGNFRFTRAEVEKLFRETTAKFAERRKSQRFEVHFPVKPRSAKASRSTRVLSAISAARAWAW
jgi:excisionase family DNA binding protein